MSKHIDEVEITIFDTETTGLNPFAGDRIVELAGLRVKGQERIAMFEALVNCGRPISPEAFAVNKITLEMLQGAENIKTVMPKFLDFAQNSCLCSYNAEFDLNFLNNELKLMGQPQINNLIIFDVLGMARKLLLNLPRYPLWLVAQKLEVKTTQQHRAFADVELTWEVFTKLKIIAETKGIADFDSFNKLFSYKPKL